MPKKLTPAKAIQKAADMVHEAKHHAEIDRLIAIHGKDYQVFITAFIGFWESNTTDWGTKRLLFDDILKDIIFRITPHDLLDKYKAPRAPDWVLEAQEKVRQINSHIHEINQQAIDIRKLRQETEQIQAKVGQPVRRRLPDTRQAITHKFNIGGHEGYMTVGMFEDGTPGELFVTMAKEGSTIGGLMDTIGTLTSLSLQYGVDIKTLAKKFSHQRFEPSGFTGNPEIKTASSIIDYVFRWMEIYFVTSRQAQATAQATAQVQTPEPAAK